MNNQEGGGMRVCVIEHDEVLNAIWCARLEALGHNVDTAHDLETSQRRLADRKIDVVLAGWSLLEADPGSAFLSWARQVQPNLRVVVSIPAHEYFDHEPHALSTRIGADAVIISPTTEEDLTLALEGKSSNA